MSIGRPLLTLALLTFPLAIGCRDAVRPDTTPRATPSVATADATPVLPTQTQEPGLHVAAIRKSAGRDAAMRIVVAAPAVMLFGPGPLASARDDAPLARDPALQKGLPETGTLDTFVVDDDGAPFLIYGQSAEARGVAFDLGIYRWTADGWSRVASVPKEFLPLRARARKGGGIWVGGADTADATIPAPWEPAPASLRIVLPSGESKTIWTGAALGSIARAADGALFAIGAQRDRLKPSVLRVEGEKVASTLAIPIPARCKKETREAVMWRSELVAGSDVKVNVPGDEYEEKPCLGAPSTWIVDGKTLKRGPTVTEAEAKADDECLLLEGVGEGARLTRTTDDGGIPSRCCYESAREKSRRGEEWRLLDCRNASGSYEVVTRFGAPRKVLVLDKP